MIHELRLFFVALQFLTRVPSPRWVGFEPDWLNQSARWFPLVGAFVGAVAALVLWAASVVFPPAVAVGLSIAVSVLLTGGFHEDGLADTTDALGGAVGRERALEIMKDSRIGSCRRWRSLRCCSRTRRAGRRQSC
ncbi:MAG: adenosylcobinamide-GDP ribazoletransferase [Pseudomonadota bacterium]